MVNLRLLILILWLCGQATAQTSITLRGQTYNLKDHPRVWFDGPGGAADLSNKFNVGPPAKATLTNPGWKGLTSNVTALLSSYPYSAPANWRLYFDGSAAATLALHWYSDNSQTASHDAALYLLNHIEKYYQMPCDETNGRNCNYPYSPTSYGMVFYAADWTLAYELMRSEMTTPQRQEFAAKVLNDVSAFGGINGSPSTSCTNPTVVNGATLTVDASGFNAVASAPLFGPGQALQVGDWVVAASHGVTQITAITDSTHATLAIGNIQAFTNFSGPISYRRAAWQPGDCGVIWISKHEYYNPPVLSLVGGVSQYPLGSPAWGAGGLASELSDPAFGVHGWAGNNTFAQAYGLMAYFLSLVDDDPNSAQRSQSQMTTLYDDWYANGWQAIYTTTWTGYHHTAQFYSVDRPRAVANMHVIVENSIAGTPPALGGVWDRNLLYHAITGLLPAAYAVEMSWGQENLAPARWDAQHTAYHMPLYFLYRNTNEGKWFNWTLRNRILSSASDSFGAALGTSLLWTAGGYGTVGGAGSFSPWLYAFTDPSWPSADVTTSAPTALVLNQVDAGSNQKPQSVLLSRTGYSSVTDTLTELFGLFNAHYDHNIAHNIAGSAQEYPADYRIFKGNYLLAPDNTSAKSTITSIGGPRFTGGGAGTMYMEIGGGYNTWAAVTPLKATMPKGIADPQNRYAYALTDTTQSYTAGTGVTRSLRHLIDFKGGAYQIIVVYDDVVTSAGKTKRTYLHYPNTAAAGDGTRGATSFSGTQITSSYPGTGHADATQLLTAVLAPAGPGSVAVYTDNVDGTYSGGSGGTFRVSVCASADGSTCSAANTAAEFAVVHMPVTGSANTLPTTAMLSTIAANWRGVQIGGAAPKVALFRQGGTTDTSTTFTSTHSGTAQYVVAGLAAGVYAVSGPTITSGTVGADGTLYFEGASGVYTVAQGEAQPAPSGTGSVVRGRIVRGRVIR